MAESIWAKIGGAVKTGVKATGDVFALVPKALIYPIKKPFASMDEMKHDATVSLKEAVGIDVPKEKREYDPPVKTTQASEDLSVQITKQEKGKVSFLASRTLTGDVPYLTPEQLGKIEELNKENKYSSIAVFREENKVVIEVNVEDIIKKVKDNPGMDEKTIKEHVLKKIYDEVDHNLKGLAKITGGEFKVHTDQKLLHGIAEKLYREYDNQNKSSEILVSGKSSSTPELTNEIIKEGNMTNPLLAYYQPEVIAGKASGVESSLKGQKDIVARQARELGSILNLKDASSEAIKPLSTPSVKENKEVRGKGLS